MDMKEFANITITRAEEAVNNKNRAEGARLLNLLAEAIKKQADQLIRETKDV